MTEQLSENTSKNYPPDDDVKVGNRKEDMAHIETSPSEQGPNLDKLIRLHKKGEGVYGIVYSACEQTNQTNTFAVKRNLIDKEGDFIGSLRELDILIRLNGHPHIVSVNSISFGDPFDEHHGDTLSPIAEDDYKDDKIHFVFEEARENASTYFPVATWAELKQCCVHLLLAIEYCHARGIIHRDLKPANLLIFDLYNNKVPDIEDNIILKVCDFGLSKPATYQGIQTPSVVTSWYRAPEIVLDKDYDEKADLWSVGCILYEMITKIPLLHGSPDRAETIIDHLNLLFPDLIPNPNNKRLLKQQGRKLNWQKILHQQAPTEEMAAVGWDMDFFVDLLEGLLCQAQDRFSATEALNHEFFDHDRAYIEKIRQQYPPVPDEESVIKMVSNRERDGAICIAKKIFLDRHKFDWYSHRILFQALSLFDRYLVMREANELLEIKKIRLAFTTCLYLAVKYFSTLCTLIPFSALYGEISDDDKRWAEQFEITLLERITAYTIYQRTLYESADSLDEILDDCHVEDLLNIYLNGKVKIRGTEDVVEINNLTPSQVYCHYRGKEYIRR